MPLKNTTPEDRVRQALEKNEAMRLGQFSADFSVVLVEMKSADDIRKIGLQLLCRVFGKEATGLSEPPYSLFKDGKGDVSWLRVSSQPNVSNTNLSEPVLTRGHGMDSLTKDAKMLIQHFLPNSQFIDMMTKLDIHVRIDQILPTKAQISIKKRDFQECVGSPNQIVYHPPCFSRPSTEQKQVSLRFKGQFLYTGVVH